MRFHVIGLPHTEVKRIPSTCAYTQKVRKFCNMMHSLGHEVTLYSPGEAEVHCEHISTGEVSDEMDFTVDACHWHQMHKTINEVMGKRPGEYLCLIAGRCQEELALMHPEMIPVEFGVGYGGTFAPFRVFESYAWMHTVYGSQSNGDAHAADGCYYDAVIPNYFEVDDFPFGEGDGNYLLYVGRLIERKGLRVVEEIARRTSVPVYVAGEGDYDASHTCTMLGVLNPEERAKWMGGARALLSPTQYIEPFGGVHVEAMLCGTPVITTDWGAYTETVDNGWNGYRCRTLSEFMKATEMVKGLDRKCIRDDAIAFYDVDMVRYDFQDYFNKLETLKHDGWYT